MSDKLKFQPLREQAYHFLRRQLQNGRFLPGSVIHLTDVAKHLGISKTPLKDAFIQLELEGFVSILPRRAIRVNGMALKDIANAYGIVGALESSVILQCFDRIDRTYIERMEALNDQMIADVGNDDFGSYYEKNLAFHDVCLELSDNTTLKKLILPVKQRLYDFPKKSYIQEWELRNCWEHLQFIELVKKGDREGAARLLTDVHWSYEAQETYIRKFHFLVAEEIRGRKCNRCR